MSTKVLVVGGGLFGCSTAIELSKVGMDVTLMEKNNDIMLGASKCNHNRIHFGFHYPRSIETARESLDGLVLFLMKFKNSIVSDFPNYYLIEKNSKVTSEEYLEFCDKIGINYDFNWPDNMVNNEFIDMSLQVSEPIFDYRIIKEYLENYLVDNGVNLKLNHNFTGSDVDGYDYIVNSSYGNINNVNDILGVPKINIKLQDVIVPAFNMNHDKIGLTIMDGPFCSIMPKGFRKNTFLLYHVKHSIGCQTFDGNIDGKFDIDKQIDKIYRSSSKYYPFLNNSNVYRSSYWRTLRALPINDNDERLSEIFYDEDNPRFISILSGKVSSCWSTALKVKDIIQRS
tara:strand:- start:372 stop:1394 length:1023 start_codon:yes stop_codon:yes gene_type:complete